MILHAAAADLLDREKPNGLACEFQESVYIRVDHRIGFFWYYDGAAAAALRC